MPALSSIVTHFAFFQSKKSNSKIKIFLQIRENIQNIFNRVKREFLILGDLQLIIVGDIKKINRTKRDLFLLREFVRKISSKARISDNAK